MKLIFMHFKIYCKYLLITLIALLAGLSSARAADPEFTIVIDAGHGGKDVGAVDNGVKEKDVNLGVALKLAKLVKDNHKNIKVVLTRNSDTFLSLQERANVANKAKADLFISIHTNSVDLKNPNRKSISGASTYTLGLHKDKDNMDVARRENSVMTYEADYQSAYSGFDPNSDESYIIFEMAQKANLSQSVKFAEAVQRQMVKVAGRTDRGVKQAGFWVLWATSMPSVLVELDFITNPTVAEFIGSDSGQKKLATAISNAVDTYFSALSAERKTARRQSASTAKAPAASAAEQTSPSSPDMVTLAAAPAEKNRKATSNVSSSSRPSSSSSSGTATARRRRNDRARAKSENQEYQVAVINESRDYLLDSSADQLTDDSSSAATQSDNDKATKNKKKDKKKDKKESKKNPKNKKQASAAAKPTQTASAAKSTQTASASPLVASSTSVNSTNKYTAAATAQKQVATTRKPAAKPAQQAQPAQTAVAQAQKPAAKQTPVRKSSAKTPKQAAAKADKSATSGVASSVVRLDKKSTVYKIQILTSETLLKSSNPLFCGLSPISCTKSDNIYKYTYGESTDSEEINRLLKDVKKKFPEAFIVSSQK